MCDDWVFLAQDKADMASGFVGLEVEQRFSPGTIQARFNHTRLAAKSASWSELAKQTIGYGGDVIAAMRSEIAKLFREQSNFIVDTPHHDGLGLECVFPPCTLKAHKVLIPEYLNILNLYQEWGFNCQQGGDGRNAR